MKTTQRFYLFLDVDGVLHPIHWEIPGLSPEDEARLAPSELQIYMATRGLVSVPDGQLLGCLPLLEDTLRPNLDQVDIVITSSWRRQKAAYRMLLDAMSEDVRARVVGKTQPLGRRSWEIESWLKKHSKSGVVPVILDDTESEGLSLGHYGVWIKPKASTGFGMPEAQALRQVLRGYTFVFLDTEFTDIEAPNPELISLGMVPELRAECFRSNDGGFYGERPRSDWWSLASPWVRAQVVPHLLQSRGVSDPMKRDTASLARQAHYWLKRRHLTTYIVTNAPEYDFELLKALLDPWPENVAPFPIRFDTFCTPGDIRDAVSQAGMNWYRDNGPVLGSLFDKNGKLQHDGPLPKAAAPAHHSLNDACALRAAWERAIQLGWDPEKFYREVLVDDGEHHETRSLG